MKGKGLEGPTPLPMAKVVLLGAILAANQMSIWMIFTQLPFLVEYYYPYMSVKELGFRAGILGSAFSMGALFGNLMWGVVADNYGRRPALIYGLVGTIISSVLFAFATNFWAAVAARALWGFLNGNVGVGKTVMAEILDDSNNAKGMALFSVIAGVGRAIGPILGGFLSSPADHYPYIFRGSLFETFPFALPSLIVSCTCAVVVLVAVFNLNETLKAPNSLNLGRDSLCSCCIAPPTRSIVSSQSQTRQGEILSVVKDKTMSGTESSHNKNQKNTKYSPLDTSEHDDDNDDDDDDDDDKGLCHEKENSPGIASNALDITGKKKQIPLRVGEEGTRRVGFSNVVVVKVIGSESLAFGSLKRLSTEDVPVPFLPGRENNTTGTELEWNEEEEVEEREEEEEAKEEDQMEQEEEQTEAESRMGENESRDDTLLSPPSPPTKLKNTVRLKKVKSDHLPKNKLRFSNGAEFFATSEKEEESGRMPLLTLLYYLLSRRDILLSTLLYGLNGFVQCIATEIFPLWVVTSVRDGGFGFDSNLIGIAVAISGVSIIVGNLVFYPIAVASFGLSKTYRMSAMAVAVFLILMPSVPFARKFSSPGVTWACLVGLLALYNSISQWVLTCIFTLINNSCYSHQRGTVNGIGQTFAALGRMFGPYFGATLFAWTEVSHHSWPLNYALVWYLIGALSILASQLGHLFKRNIERRKREPKEPRYANSMRRRTDSATNETAELLAGLELLQSPQSKSKSGRYPSSAAISEV